MSLTNGQETQFSTGVAGIVPGPTAAQVAALNLLRADGTWGTVPSGGTILFADGTNAAPSISFLSNSTTGIYLDAANVLGVATNGNGTVLFSSSAGVGKIKAHGTRVLALEAGTGNTNITLTPSGTGGVGIGTSSPNALLEVNGNIRNSTSAQSVFTHNIDVLSTSVAANLFNSIANATITIGGGITSGNVKIGTSTGGLTVLGSSSSGFVGIGTTSPNNPLVVSDAGAAGIEFTPSSGSIFCFNRSTSAFSPIGIYASTVVIAIGGAASTALSIDASSNATFGGTIKPQQAATVSAPTYVKGAIYFDTTLNKLRVGGATAWETITSV